MCRFHSTGNKYFGAKAHCFLLNGKLLLGKTCRFEEMHFAKFHQHCNIKALKNSDLSKWLHASTVCAMQQSITFFREPAHSGFGMYLRQQGSVRFSLRIGTK